MARSYEVLAMLRPNGGYIQYGEEFEGIEFVDCEPLTKAEWEAGFAQYDFWKAEQTEARATQKAALLDRLGLTQEEFNTLTA
jgi:predicted Ser/Thr protein kinase